MLVPFLPGWVRALAIHWFSGAKYWVALMVDADVLEAEHGKAAVDEVEARLARAGGDARQMRFLRDLRFELQRRRIRAAPPVRSRRKAAA